MKLQRRRRRRQEFISLSFQSCTMTLHIIKGKTTSFFIWLKVCLSIELYISTSDECISNSIVTYLQKINYYYSLLICPNKYVLETKVVAKSQRYLIRNKFNHKLSISCQTSSDKIGRKKYFGTSSFRDFPTFSSLSLPIS